MNEILIVYSNDVLPVANDASSGASRPLGGADPLGVFHVLDLRPSIQD